MLGTTFYFPSFDMRVHTYTDGHLVQQSVEVSPAVVKTNFVDIPGKNGFVDLTEAIAGEPQYQSRTIKWIFAILPDYLSEKQAIIDYVMNINGLSCYIVLDSDTDYYYKGRVSVDSVKSDGQLQTIEVSAYCEPYAYGFMWDEEISLNTNWQSYQFESSTPTFYTLENEVDILYKIGENGSQRRLLAGTHEDMFYSSAFQSNEVYFKVSSGTTYLTIKYQEGKL